MATEKKKQEIQVFVYDFTLKAEGITVEQLKEFLPKWAKKWVFQLECGDTGYVHYQGRISLIKKRRAAELADKIKKTGIAWPFDWSVSSTNSLGDEFYYTKEDTRVEGPWKDTDEVLYIPRQVRNKPVLRPWQQYIVDRYDEWDERTVNVIYDPVGCKGKTVLKNYVMAHNLGEALPPFNNYKDIMRTVMDIGVKRLYILDMPRSISKESLYGLMSGIETIKDGYAFDDRYKFRRILFDCPNIWIFTNKPLDMEYLSADRWRLWKINDAQELEPLAEFF